MLTTSNFLNDALDLCQTREKPRNASHNRDIVNAIAASEIQVSSANIVLFCAIRLCSNNFSTWKMLTAILQKKMQLVMQYLRIVSDNIPVVFAMFFSYFYLIFIMLLMVFAPKEWIKTININYNCCLPALQFLSNFVQNFLSNFFQFCCNFPLICLWKGWYEVKFDYFLLILPY